MDEWVLRALKRWPNVPALFGWLALDRRGRWLIRGEPILHPRIIGTINRNYACDAHGRWFFQNGPQRGYMRLESAPFVLRADERASGLVTHTQLPVNAPTAAYLDEEGALVIATEHGPGELLGADLDWALRRIRRAGRPATEDELADALAAPSGELTTLSFEICGKTLPLARLDFADAPGRLKYVRDPAPLPDERTGDRAPD